jgi:D-alanyl-D-alanine carboxypeptidase
MFRGRRRRVRAALVVVAATAVGVAVAAVLVAGGGKAPSGDRSGASRPELQRVLDGLVTGPDRIAPGATAYVAGPHGAWRGAAGVADLRTRAPMRPDARLRLESVSKIYTAALVVALAQDGRLRLDDTVERWLPGLLPDGHRITIRQLLTMRSGLIDDNDIRRSPARYLRMVHDRALRGRMLAASRRVTADPDATFSPMLWVRWAAWIPLLSTPGTASHYSNIGYDVLGRIAERAGGEPLSRAFADRVFAPLALRRTAYDPQGPITGSHARGYFHDARGRWTDTTGRHAGIGAGGGIVADAPETAAFLTALMRGRVVGRGAVAGMRGRDLWEGGEPSGCGGNAFGWSGGGDGYKTNVWVDADGSRVAVLLLNARDVSDNVELRSSAALQRLYCAA